MDRVVRGATPADEEEVMALCMELDRENGLFPMSEAKVRTAVRGAINRSGGIIGLIGDPGAVEAMIYLTIGQQWCSEEWILEERFVFCRPEFRMGRPEKGGFNNSKMLIEFAKKCASELNMPLMIGVLSNSQTEHKVRLYRRQFGEPVGAFFVFNTKWDMQAWAAKPLKASKRPPRRQKSWRHTSP